MRRWPEMEGSMAGDALSLGAPGEAAAHDAEGTVVTAGDGEDLSGIPAATAASEEAGRGAVLRCTIRVEGETLPVA